ncbi:hypothetical protein MACK_003023 [Theileria orientalis]|uniref:RRM domain-containing protein n=1 Tax=Theileria orientalis TaxID=68886 RepID=A0A976QVF1_THEOR|nr:hypothetical protein MACK_003023 [Theileria orientalis]
MARKTKAQDKEAESAPSAEKTPEENPTEETEENTVVESGEEQKPESTADSNDSCATEPETTNETGTNETSSETTSNPPATQTSTIEKPPSTGLIASHLPNTLIDSTLKFFVGGLHPNTDETELSNYFAKYGQILSTQVMRDLNTGRHRGFGFVTLKVQHNSMNVFKDSHTVTGKRVDVRAMQTDVAASLKKKIFVGGLSKALNEEMLDEYFSKFGEVEKVTIMRQLDGTSRGFGFIVFTTEEAASGALRNPTHFVYGNKVDVRAAETRPKQSGPHHANAVYPYGIMQAPADMYSAAAPMYRPQGAYDPAQYANMTQQQMVQHQYPQYQLLQQQMLQQQMSMAGTYGGYYSSSTQQATPAATTNPTPYSGASVSYGAYRGREGSYQGGPGSDPSSRGYRQQPY